MFLTQSLPPAQIEIRSIQQFNPYSQSVATIQGSATDSLLQFPIKVFGDRVKPTLVSLSLKDEPEGIRLIQGYALPLDVKESGEILVTIQIDNPNGQIIQFEVLANYEASPWPSSVGFKRVICAPK